MTQQSQPQKSNGAKWFLIGGLILLALLAAAVIIYIVFFAKLAPRDLAIRHVNDEIDYVGETMTSWIVGENWILKNLGGEYIEDKIHQVIKWQYGEPELIAGSRYNVNATASVKFGIDYEIIGSFYIQAHLPYDVVVDERRQVVASMTPRYSEARLTSEPQMPALNPLDALNVPNIGNVKDKAESAMEDIESEIDATIGDAADKIEDAIDTDAAKDALRNLPGLGQ